MSGGGTPHGRWSGLRRDDRVFVVDVAPCVCVCVPVMLIMIAQPGEYGA